MTGIVRLTEQALKEASDYKHNFVLPGLSKGEYGFIIGSPGIGKGHFALSLSYELSANIEVVGINANSQPIRIIYWPAEEKKLNVLRRIQKHLGAFPARTRELIYQNLSIYDDYEPICAPTTMFGSPIYEMAVNSRNQLIQAAKKADLIIIDTIREAVGACKEVEHDLEIKLALQEIAASANCAVLVTHHPTKELTKKKELVTSVAGSGLSLAQATSRYALYLESGKDKKLTFLSHTKHNNVEQVYVQNQTKLLWTNESLVHNPELFLPYREVDNNDEKSELTINDEEMVIARAAEQNPIKATEINLEQIEIPKDELEKSKLHRESNAYISNDEKEKYKSFLKQQQNNN